MPKYFIPLLGKIKFLFLARQFKNIARVSAQPPTTPVYLKATQTFMPIQVDGLLDEQDWVRA